MFKKSLFLLATCLSLPVMAGLNDGILAYQNKMYPTALMELTYLQEEGDPVATYYMGKMYLEGLGVPQNKNRAKSLFEAADKAYYFPASAELGKILVEDGKVQLALPYLKKATLAGEAEAAFQLGQIYGNDTSPFYDLNQAYGYYLIAALGGHMKAQYQLGKIYLAGRGVTQDYQSALKWITRAAKQGYVLAQVDLADMYLTNKQFANKGQAYAWYSLLAAYNNDEVGQRAQEKRDELEKKLNKKELVSYQQALSKWKFTPAERSVSKEDLTNIKVPVIYGFNDAKSLQESLVQLGFLPRNPQRYGLTNALIDQAMGLQSADALTHKIEKAQENGKKDAYGYYGDLFKSRFNNLKEAFHWYQQGAKAGDVYAQYQMSKMLCEGLGVEPNIAQCYAGMIQVQEAQHPVLNVLAQNALSTILAQADEKKLQEALGPEEKQEKKKSNNSEGLFDFF